MDKELFTTWLEKIFWDIVGEERWSILIVDSYDGHFPYELKSGQYFLIFMPNYVYLKKEQ